MTKDEMWARYRVLKLFGLHTRAEELRRRWYFLHGDE